MPSNEFLAIGIQAEAASGVKAACLVNLANCAHKEQQYGEALDWCNKALRYDLLPQCLLVAHNLCRLLSWRCCCVMTELVCWLSTEVIKWDVLLLSKASPQNIVNMLLAQSIVEMCYAPVLLCTLLVLAGGYSIRLHARYHKILQCKHQ